MTKKTRAVKKDKEEEKKEEPKPIAAKANNEADGRVEM